MWHDYEGEIYTGAGLRPYPVVSVVPPGRYRIEFTTDDGLRGETGFEVESTTDAVKLRLDLK